MVGAEAWPWLILAGAAAGWMDAIAGGGGLITVPALLACGLPPHVALGTNKLQALFGSSTAAWQYRKAGLVSARHCLRGLVLAFAGAVAGSWSVQAVAPDALRRLIPLLLLAVTFYFAIRPGFGAPGQGPRWPLLRLEALAAPMLGFYDGFFGPGTGTFWTLVLVAWGGMELTRATARTKVMNFASNAGALLVFAAAGSIDIAAGLGMGLAQAAGARLGARVAAARGRRFIRPVFLAVVLGLTLRVAWDAWQQRPGPAHAVAPTPAAELSRP